VRTVKICDPLSGGPFPSFVHNTTTYVGIPHDRQSQLFVNCSGPCRVCVQSGGRTLVCQDTISGQVVIPLSELQAPPVPPGSIAEWLLSFLRKHECGPHRLYRFAAIIQSQEPGHPVLATYDFHILCPVEYAEAMAYHHALQTNPAAIAPDAIADRAEGRTCPYCRQVRKTLHQHSG
jgi:hypothetical protein